VPLGWLIDYEEPRYGSVVANERLVQREMAGDVVPDPVLGAADPVKRYWVVVDVGEDSKLREIDADLTFGVFETQDLRVPG
jgi:hypothetical protein